MKQATPKRPKKQSSSTPMIDYGPFRQRLREGGSILLFALAAYFCTALFTFDMSDGAWSHTGESGAVLNAAGKAGAWAADLLYAFCGYMAYLLPLALFYLAVGLLKGNEKDKLTGKQNKKPVLTPYFLFSIRFLGLLLAMVASAGITAMHFSQAPNLPMNAGGILGEIVKMALVGHLNYLGATIMLLAFFLIGITFFTGLSWIVVVEKLVKASLWLIAKCKARLIKIRLNTHVIAKLPKTPKIPPISHVEENTASKDRLKSGLEKLKSNITHLSPMAPISPIAPVVNPVINPMEKIKEKLKEKIKEKDKDQDKNKDKNNTKKQHQDTATALSLDFLEIAQQKQRLGYTPAQLKDLSQLVEARLLEFGIKAQVVGVFPGPVITRFELQLAAGIKVSRLTSLVKDLARALSVVSVRVVEVIPGKSFVGIEIPNLDRELIRLREIIDSESYQEAKSPLTMALGKDIGGRPVVVDLARMPHLLVAGTTGAGKSVGLNAMLLSVLYKSSPEDVRMILIDPKMLELAVYDNIPHLLTPVVTDMKDAANALRWCVAEMERRYQLMAALGVRNLGGFNQKVIEAETAGSPLANPLQFPKGKLPKDEPIEYLSKLPYIIVLVDEFADMIMVVGKKVEELITRIAQKARAAGIHLILATQRPSVDVITGLIKANIPTRIAFQVSSRIDSRTILDQQGAEQLLGHGDMLYLPAGAGIPVRVHGAFVADEEVHKVTEKLRACGTPEYIDIIGGVSSGESGGYGGGEDSDDYDELYDQALAIVTESRKASISNVQRRLKIGYNRAARLIERMEAEGVVTAMQSNGGREVLAPPPVIN